MAATDPTEPEVRAYQPMPKGYQFVPKGNVYITKHCRKKTHEAEKTLYVVLNDKNKPIGLRCPASIHQSVAEQDKATATQRAAVVQKRDTAIVEDFEAVLLKLFPKIPKKDIPRILKHSLRKNSGRVGRSNTMALEDRVKLAVRAHIRHIHTEYDQLLRKGMPRDDARKQIWDKLNDIAREWGGRPPKPTTQVPARRKGKKKPQRQSSTRSTKYGRKNGSVKKAVVVPASRSRFPTRGTSRETTELPHRPRRGDASATNGKHLAGNLELDDDGFLNDVDFEDDVFTMDEDSSDYDSDGRNWSESS